MSFNVDFNSGDKKTQEVTTDSLSSTVEAPMAEVKKEHKSNRMRSFLKNENIYLYSTIAVVIAVIPFTISALGMYITFGESKTSIYLAWIMCTILAIAIDFSILVFTINGNLKYAKKGSQYQFIFLAVHFMLIKDYLNLIGLDGEMWQSIITKTCIVIYVPILINQFSKLANVENEIKN